jgi:hypothetical protein
VVAAAAVDALQALLSLLRRGANVVVAGVAGEVELSPSLAQTIALYSASTK